MISARFFEEVFYSEIYKPVKELGNIATVIDLGACTGEFSLWVYPQAERIYAIEPDREAYKHLKENVKEFEKIKTFRLAITGKNGIAGMSGGSIGAKSIVHNVTQNPQQIVKIQTLATFMKKNGIEIVDCLKTDAESAEDEIFKAEDFSEVADKIKFIIGEHLKGSKVLLGAYGFKIENYEHGLIAKRI